MGRSPVRFAVGDEVEVLGHDEGFRGSLFEARIVRSATKQKRYTIEYETLMSEADQTKNLRESVAAAYLRPRPCPIRRSSFEIGEKVDAFHNDGWWEGEISKVLEGGKRYGVRFTYDEDDDDGGSKEELEYGLDEIRLHMDWVDGQWISPEAPVQDKFDIQQDLRGTEPEAIRQILHAISIVHEAQISLQRSISNDGTNENPCKSHSSAAILDSVNPEESKSRVQLELSHPCEKSENGEVQNGLKLYDSLLLAKDGKSHCTVESGYQAPTPVTEERTEDNPHCATNPMYEDGLFHSNMVMSNPLQSLLGETGGVKRIYADISQPFPQHALPCVIEPSTMEGKTTKLVITGSVNQQNLANLDHPSNYPLEIDVQQPRKRVLTSIGRDGKVSSYGKILEMEFKKGDVVEICSDDDGFCGAWYVATIIGSDGKNFLVEYQNLRADDGAKPLTETVDSLNIRHIPPVTPVSCKFKLLQEVDAFHNDGWWVGIISKVFEGSRYMVYFKTWNEEIAFGQSELRPHHEWIDGKWQHVSEALRLSDF